MTLRLLLDEQISRQIQRELDRYADTEHVVDVSSLGAGSDDDEIWRYAVQNDYIIFSADNHFIDGTANPNNGTYPGVIKCNSRNSQVIGNAISNLTSALSHKEIADTCSPFHIPGGWYSP